MDHPFMLVTHRQPDGDAIGACLGLAEALREGGARAQVFLWGPLPRWFSDLADRLGKPAWSNDPFPVSWSRSDRLILLDTSDLTHCGPDGPALDTPITMIVDHHTNTPAVAGHTIIDPHASSTCELIMRHWSAIGQILGVPLQLSPWTAAWLALGIRTDTLAFQTSTVTSDTWRCMAACADTGAPINETAQRLTRSMTSLLLDLQAAIWRDRLTVGPLVVLTAQKKTLEFFGVSPNDVKVVLGYAAMASDVDIVALIVEDAETNTYRLSVRSATPGHALALATRFGGGGHSMSAGATIPRTTSIARLRTAVIQAGSALFEETTP